MQIIEATIHHLQKAAYTHGEDSVTTHLRESDLPIDETLQGVCRDLLALYNRTSDSFGMLATQAFNATRTHHAFGVGTQDHLEQHARRIRTGARSIVAIARIEAGEVEIMIQQMIDRIRQ